MPDIEDQGREQTAVLWPLTGWDAYAQPIVGAPREIEVRILSHRANVLDASGNRRDVDSKAVFGERVDVGSAVWLGTLADWNNGAYVGSENDVLRVDAYDEIPDVRGRATFRPAVLSRSRFHLTPGDALAPEPFHRWRFSEGIGVAVADSGVDSRKMHGVLERDEVRWVTDTPEGSQWAAEWLESSRVRLTISGTLSNLSAFTVALWIKRRAPAAGSETGTGSGTGSGGGAGSFAFGRAGIGCSAGGGWFFGVSGSGDHDGRMSFARTASGGSYSSDVIHSTRTIAADVWNHIAVTVDGAGTVRFFLAGQLESIRADQTWTAVEWTSQANYWIGAESANVKMDDVRIYDRVLTAPELRAVTRG